MTTKEQDCELDSRQSTLITAMRFPLIVLVVVAHSVGYYENLHVRVSLDGWNVFHFVSEMISHHLGPMAVCWFFLLSGYLLFLNLPKDGFTMKWMSDKWKKRLRTLVLPYLMWNLLVVAIFIVKWHSFQRIGIPQSSEDIEAVRQGPWFWLVTGPIDFPLWYMRSLIVMTILAPLVWMLAAKSRIVFPIAMTLLYLSPLEVPFVLMHSVYFFSIGAWLGLHKINILSFSRRIKTPVSILAALTLIVATLRTGYADHTFWLRLFYPFGMITFMNICDRLIDNDNRKIRLTRLSAAVFFIYATHEIYILGWTKGLFVRIFGETLPGTWIKYIFVPIVVLAICLALYRLLNLLMPRTLAFLCGGRSSKSSK